MIIPTRVSRFLGQADVAETFVATIDKVTVDNNLRNPFVLWFTGTNVKPLPLNAFNRRALISAFGSDADQWRGRQVEIYVDPNVTNSRGEVVGGLRIRIPLKPQQPASRTAASDARRAPVAPSPRPASATPRPQAAKPPFPKQPAPRPAPPRPPAAKEPTIDDRHKELIGLYRTARSERYVKELATWASQQDFAPHHLEEQSDAYHDALVRLGVKQPVPMEHADA